MIPIRFFYGRLKPRPHGWSVDLGFQCYLTVAPIMYYMLSLFCKLTNCSEPSSICVCRLFFFLPSVIYIYISIASVRVNTIPFNWLQNDKLMSEISKLKTRACSKTYISFSNIYNIFPKTSIFVTFYSRMQEIELTELNAMLKQQAEVQLSWLFIHLLYVVVD